MATEITRYSVGGSEILSRFPLQRTRIAAGLLSAWSLDAAAHPFAIGNEAVSRFPAPEKFTRAPRQLAQNRYRPAIVHWDGRPMIQCLKKTFPSGAALPFLGRMPIT